MKNESLNKAKQLKNDEFYTLYQDIEEELSFYKAQLKGKSVYCNCDNPDKSNFWAYFKTNFKLLGLKKISCTYYNQDSNSFVTSYDGEKEIKMSLKGNGDFRSEECIKIAKNHDIICTNPPFSLMKEFIPMMLNLGKQILIVGSINMVKYKNVFPYVKENKLWLGYKTGTQSFLIPDGNDLDNTYVGKDGLKYAKFGNIVWLTNIDIPKRHVPLSLSEEYNPVNYKKYDNYDAIDVGKVKKIPINYEGIMGVPITFLQYHCVDQYEIIGEFNHGCDNEYDLAIPFINKKSTFPRIAIRKLYC